MANVSLWLIMEVIGNKVQSEFVFFQFMECSPPCDNKDEVLKCRCLCWGTDDDTIHTLPERFCISGEESLRARERPGAEGRSSIKGTIHVIRELFAVELFSHDMTWPSHESI